MASLQEYMAEYRAQMERGVIQKAYRGLMEYLMGLRSYFAAKHPEFSVGGGLYSGYMDMSYFSLSPEPLKSRNLKIAVVFLHESFRFEVWLAGYNKQAQQQYWRLFKESGWREYRLVPSTKGADAIIEGTLVDKPDFGDPEKLTGQIEDGVLRFIDDVEGVLAGNGK